MLFKTNEPAIPDCIYNKAVACDPKTQNCERCGWNPEVAKARLEKIINKGVTQPKEE